MKIHLTLAAALLLAACGNDERPTSTEPAQTSTEETRAAPAPEISAPAERGRKAFSACAVCHSFRPNEPARVGPNLYGVYGQPAGQREGFNYSPALKASGLVWDDETLDAFIESPQTLVRRNRMSYAGQKDPQKRADIIAYMKTLRVEEN